MAKTMNVFLADIVSRYTLSGDGSPMLNVWGKAHMHLRRYMEATVKLVSGEFDSVQVWWIPDKYSPSLQDTDVLVYVLPGVHKSIIASQGGDVSRAQAGNTVLGTTQIGSKTISEVYWDRMVNPKELAGAAFHEAAHNKSQQDDAMHNGKKRLLKAAPDYLHDPSPEDLAFMARRLSKKVKQWPGLVPR